MNKSITKSRNTKREKVTNLAEKIKGAKSVIFSDYRGLTASQISNLRAKIKEAGGELLVTKNTLLARALQLSTINYQLSTLDGPTATVLAYEDELAPLKEIAQSAKTIGLPKFKFGFLGRDFLDIDALESLSKISSRSELYTKVVGSLNSPIYGIVSVLQANIRNLVSILDQVSKKIPASA